MTTVTIKRADASGIGESFSVRPPTTRPRTQPIGTRLGTLFKFAVRRAIEQALGTTAWGKPPRGITVRIGFVLYLLLTAAFALLLFGPLLWG